jgi:Tol biopolymer transport system component
LWHQDYALNYQHGSQLADLAGLQNRVVDTNETAVPTRDGLHYVIFDYNIHTDVTLVTIKETASGNTVYQASFNGYVRKIRPSPVNLNVLLVTWGSSAISNDEDFNIVDMAAKKILDTLPAQNAGMDWLPDGRYVHLGSTGILNVGIVGGIRTAAGQISVPGRVPRGLWANREGSKVISRWVVLNADGDVTDTDVWISSLDGSGLERLTATNRTTYAVWSPDSRWVAFNEDAASVCSGFGCSDVTGYCYLWAGDVSARNLVEGSSGVSEFYVLDKDAKRRILGCGSGLLGWTP